MNEHIATEQTQEQAEEKVESRASWKQFYRLIRDTKPSKLLLSIALGMSVIATTVGLIIPLFTKNLVDSFSSVTSMEPMQIALMALTFVAQAIAGGVSLYILNYIGQKIVAGLRDRLWKKLLVLPVPYYDNHRTGETISRMTNDTAVVKGLITDHLSSMVTGVISIIGSLAFLLYLDWQMTLIMFIAVPIAALVLVPLGKQMHKISKGMQDETASFTATLNQVLSEIRLVKSSNAEASEYKNGNKGITNLLKFGLKEARIQALISPIISFVLLMLLVVIIGYGGVRVSSGVLTAGDLVAFILYMFQIIMPVTQLSTFFTQAQKAMGATERIITTLDAPEEDHASGRELKEANLPIVVDNLTFAYESGEAILQDMSFVAEPGKVTAIVGPSGGGKTTLFSILERYYEPSSGSIKLGDERIENFTLHSWRKQIGYVSQESPLIAGTIRDNICYGLDVDVTDEQIKFAAQMAYASDFIEEFPEQYATEVGERGVKLSGGQRQRIGIARALLRDPKILMLDEATSALDTKSEIAVQEALNNLMIGRTTFVIAHRLSTIVDADQILFVEKGSITGRGTHDELFESHDLYREFATEQFRLSEQGGD
ncbi:ABC transporter ATP-binding protein/permease [Paenibacillus sp. N1-5-1-14]|uniref:ABC transporter ATP-binding protein n=1 Tax=Paenibacillus radicibacter TaxID=2972488 RepID=UPI00215942BD|nr:ABC transporter ATP-binding protein [Paenibacillus radicibacter]MCR8643137.1 ABC transporter ATP-binding protein/permease [Paenibacillus radicibacter]